MTDVLDISYAAYAIPDYSRYFMAKRADLNTDDRLSYREWQFYLSFTQPFLNRTGVHKGWEALQPLANLCPEDRPWRASRCDVTEIAIDLAIFLLITRHRPSVEIGGAIVGMMLQPEAADLLARFSPTLLGHYREERITPVSVLAFEKILVGIEHGLSIGLAYAVIAPVVVPAVITAAEAFYLPFLLPRLVQTGVELGTVALGLYFAHEGVEQFLLKTLGILVFPKWNISL